MAGNIPPQDPGSPDCSSEYSAAPPIKPPKRRADYIQPEPKKRKFIDGVPPSQPAKTLKKIVKRLKDGYYYTYSDLAPNEDIRILIVEKGSGSDTLYCKLVSSALPSTEGRVGPIPVYEYEALSYFWGVDETTVPIDIKIDIKSYNTYHSQSSNTPWRRLVTDVIPKKFFIRPNLFAALQQLRRADDDTYLWVDAICINQANPVEKSAQVKRMHEIYSKASNVCIWLGVGEIYPTMGNSPAPTTNVVNAEGTKRTFEFIRETLKLRRLDQLIVSPKHAAEWQSFVRLMRNRWFSRRWVVQELALAKEATVHYGEEVIQWRDFADAVALFVTKHDEIDTLIRSSQYIDPDPVGDMRALGANTLVEATSNLFRLSNENKILERLLDMETLVSTLLAFESTDPKDTIYAFLSIASDTPYTTADELKTPVAISPSTSDHRILPNYDKNLADVCTDFVDYCVERSKSLDIICRHWAPPADRWVEYSTRIPIPRPSWVSLISNSAFGEPEAALEGRSNGDSLVGTSSRLHQKNYNASAGLPAEANFCRHSGAGNAEETGISTNYTISAQESLGPSFPGSHTSSNDGHIKTEGPSSPFPQEWKDKRCTGVLKAVGMRLDKIRSVSSRAVQGIVLQECFEMGGWLRDTSPKELRDALWRTLVADRGPDGKNAPWWYRRACLECLTNGTQDGDLNTAALIENRNTPSTMKTFLRRVQQVVWNRTFFLSYGGRNEVPEKVLFGLAPTRAEAEDIICILFGCSVPVILREIRDQSGSHFVLIGEAYVHGMMDGEALTKENPPPAPPYTGYETFEIH